MKGKIEINREMCKGCSYCMAACPKGVISMEKSFNRMGYFPARSEHSDKCTGCALCARMCPEIAIEVWASDNKNT